MGGPGHVDGADRDEFANFLPATISTDGLRYASVEHYFQAHKTLDLEARRALASAPFDSVYALGRTVSLRSDWEAVKLKVMLRGAKLKYDQHPHLKSALLSTAGRITFTPSAGFWGVDGSGRGENWNGLIHELLRHLYRGEVDAANALAWCVEMRCAQAAAATGSAPGVALLVLDPQPAFTTGAWAQSFGDVSPIKDAFRRLSALARDLDLRAPVLATRCPFQPPDCDAIDGFELVPFTIKPSMDATAYDDERLLAFLGCGVRTLVVGGCTTTSCVRVSSRAIKKRRPGLDVVCDLSLCAARESNYLKNAVDDPDLVGIYSHAGCAGKSAVDLAVDQMRGDGVRVVDRFDWDAALGPGR